MYSEKVNVINASGLHARPASDFVQIAKGFTSKIKIKNASDPEGDEVNAKSVVMLLSLELSQGDAAQITAVGEDEEAAVKALVKFVNEGCGE